MRVPPAWLHISKGDTRVPDVHVNCTSEPANMHEASAAERSSAGFRTKMLDALHLILTSHTGSRLQHRTTSYSRTNFSVS